MANTRKKGGAVRTRLMRKRSASSRRRKEAKKAKNRSTAKRSYRKRVMNSKCRGLKTAKCRHRPGCKMSLGKKRSFCRKTRNAKHRKH